LVKEKKTIDRQSRVLRTPRLEKASFRGFDSEKFRENTYIYIVYTHNGMIHQPGVRGNASAANDAFLCAHNGNRDPTSPDGSCSTLV